MENCTALMTDTQEKLESNLFVESDVSLSGMWGNSVPSNKL